MFISIDTRIHPALIISKLVVFYPLAKHGFIINIRYVQNRINKDKTFTKNPKFHNDSFLAMEIAISASNLCFLFFQFISQKL